MNAEQNFRANNLCMPDLALRPSNETPVIVINIDQQQGERPHGHAFHELVLITAGSGRHVTKAGSWPCSAGDVFIIDPGYEHKYSDVTDLQLCNVLIHPLEEWFQPYDLVCEAGWHALFTLEPRLRQQHSFHSRLKLVGQELSHCMRLLEEMHSISRNKQGAWRHQLVSRFHQVLEILVSSTGHNQKPERRDLLHLAHCLAEIESHLTENWNVDTLCAMLDCSPSTLQRQFKQAVGIAPSVWILQRRLQRACQLLRKSPHSITDIAFDCGFEDSNYFSRQFKKQFGKSPRQYRQQR